MITQEAAKLAVAKMKSAASLLLTLAVTFAAQSLNASGLALDGNNLVHAFDSRTSKQQVETYITNLHLILSQERQLVVVSGTHGICPTGNPDKSQGCAEFNFLKEDYDLFHVVNSSYIQVVNYHNIKNWADFLNQHSNGYVVLAWCYSACWKEAPFYKVDYCPRDHSVAPSVRVACNGPHTGTPQNP